MKIIVTFWKSDFSGYNLDQLTAILKQNACSGKGYWFIDRTNYIQASFGDEKEYEWIMEHVANYGDLNINR
jgi:hypothetical protein